MTQESTFQPQIFDYYNFCVIQNYVFNEPVPVIENSYTYEENGVLYCASATEKGVYCYSYARNNPLHYVAPHKRNSGERYEVSGAGVPCCSWVATSAGDAVAVVRWDFCRLDFFGTFLIKQKSTEERHEHYPFLKIINMNGRLYDPVISRFFSPDKYVANSSFTQDFNRYSYCRNNPLKYVDPSGESFLNTLSLILFFPARVLSEAFQWVDDKISGNQRYGYFPRSYLLGRTEPYPLLKPSPSGQILYGQPGFLVR